MNGKLFVNGHFHTFDERYPVVTGVLVQGDHIIDLGDSRQLMNKYQHETTELIDLDGHIVIPGLTDSHMHLVAHGIKLHSLDFSTCQDAFEMKQMLKQKIEHTPPGEWVVGMGWNENNYADRKIFTKDELDELSQVHPIFLSRVCGHAYLANSLAFSIAGIQEDMSDPAGGKFERDEAGLLTGLLLDGAGDNVRANIPEMTYHQLKNALQAAIQDCWRVGLVGCHSEDARDCNGFTQTYKLYDDLLHQQQNRFRVHQLTYHDYMDQLLQFGLDAGSGTPYFQLGAMKIFADGALGGRSALLNEPYSDDPSTNGVAIHTQEQLLELVRMARSYQFPVAIHTIGDLALHNALEAIETYPNQHFVYPDRIIHAQVANPDLLQRARKLNIVIDIQPRFVISDFPWVVNRLGESRIEWSYAWKSMLDSGLHCAGGSDAPIEPINPLLGIHAAVTRQDPFDVTSANYGPEQRLTIQEAIKLFTSGSAYAEQMTHKKGTISKGKFADFTVYNRDLFHIEPEQWLEAQVSMTIVGGSIVYRK